MNDEFKKDDVNMEEEFSAETENVDETAGAADGESAENDSDRGFDVAEDLKKALKAGLGAILSTVEKTMSYAQEVTTEGTEANRRMTEAIDAMAKKGDEVLKGVSSFGNEMKDKIASAVNSIPVGYENILSTLPLLTEEELCAIREKAAEILAARAAQAEAEAEAAKAAEEEAEAAVAEAEAAAAEKEAAEKQGDDVTTEI